MDAGAADRQDVGKAVCMKLLFIGNPQDKSYLPYLKNSIGSEHNCAVFLGTVATLAELSAFITKAGITAVITTRQELVAKLSGKPKAKIDQHAGSMYHVDADGKTVPVLVLHPLEHYATVRHGKFLADRFLAKLLKPATFIKQTELTWDIVTATNFQEMLARFRAALYIATDIETRKSYLAIDIAGYCAIFPDGTTHAICIEIKSIYDLQMAQAFNELPQAKIFQNGGYDNAYFLRWGIPPSNYLWDTLHLFHSWYSELPKSLDFITAFMLPDFRYWKDESEGTAYERLFYNAKDTWATANCFLALIREMPAWAKRNYLMEFPLVYPALHASMEGLLVDAANRDALYERENAKLEHALASLKASTGFPAFNPSSPKQVLALLHILGCKDLVSSDVKAMKKAADMHPLNAWFVDNIIAYRKARKLLSSYLDAELLNGRFMYSLNPAGTDTGRLASGESQFWCGNQVQNIARAIKAMFVADEGWLLAECDKSQSEDRCVAVLSADKGLLDIYAGDKDSHALKGEMFFGIPYADIRKEDKEAKASGSSELTIRDLTKRVNHGSNYNMGAYVLLETMGVANVVKAKQLLKLPKHMSLMAVTEHLLDIYAKRFPRVKNQWYNQIKLEVATTQKLVGATGWTRYCFGNPNRSKPELNAYVAHAPQSLSVMVVNKELMDVWRWGLEHADVFRLKAQIHDSIFFQYRKGEDWVVDKVNSMMQTTIQVKGSDGITRPLFIPTDVKSGTTHWGKL